MSYLLRHSVVTFLPHLMRSNVLRALLRNIYFLRGADRLWEGSHCLRNQLAVPKLEGEDTAILRMPTTIYHPS